LQHRIAMHLPRFDSRPGSTTSLLLALLCLVLGTAALPGCAPAMVEDTSSAEGAFSDTAYKSFFQQLEDAEKAEAAIAKQDERLAVLLARISPMLEGRELQSFQAAYRKRPEVVTAQTTRNTAAGRLAVTLAGSKKEEVTERMLEIGKVDDFVGYDPDHRMHIHGAAALLRAVDLVGGQPSTAALAVRFYAHALFEAEFAYADGTKGSYKQLAADGLGMQIGAAELVPKLQSLLIGAIAREFFFRNETVDGTVDDVAVNVLGEMAEIQTLLPGVLDAHGELGQALRELIHAKPENLKALSDRLKTSTQRNGENAKHQRALEVMVGLSMIANIYLGASSWSAADWENARSYFTFATLEAMELLRVASDHLAHRVPEWKGGLAASSKFISRIVPMAYFLIAVVETGGTIGGGLEATSAKLMLGANLLFITSAAVDLGVTFGILGASLLPPAAICMVVGLAIALVAEYLHGNEIERDVQNGVTETLGAIGFSRDDAVAFLAVSAERRQDLAGTDGAGATPSDMKSLARTHKDFMASDGHHGFPAEGIVDIARTFQGPRFTITGLMDAIARTSSPATSELAFAYNVTPARLNGYPSSEEKSARKREFRSALQGFATGASAGPVKTGFQNAVAYLAPL